MERRRATLVIAVLTAASGIAVRFWEDVSATPVWNLRLLPFWYLGLFLLTAVGAGELVRGAGWLVGRGVVEWRAAGDDVEDLDEVDDVDEVEVSAPLESDRTQRLVSGIAVAVVAVAVAAGTLVQLHETRGFLDFWARWNYTGVEETGLDGVGKSYPEYRALLDTMADLPPGRALWEPSSDIDRYGTTLALMMLPYYTDGRISSMEGLYYESSATTPYVFPVSYTHLRAH